MTVKFKFYAWSAMLFLLFIHCEDKPKKVDYPEYFSPSNATGLMTFSDFPIGTAVNIRQLLADEKLRKLYLNNFNSITAENDMKMPSIVTQNGLYDFERTDLMVNFALRNNQRLFGHTLIWHSATPWWVEEMAASPETLDAFMRAYIYNVVSHYRGRINGWDVVNEAMNTSGGGYRETVWYKALGKSYIANAFRYAHDADRGAVLFYNDFNLERDTAKLHSVLHMIEELKAENVPIKGLGFQMHLRMDIPDSLIAYALKKGSETGLQIHLSEVDIIFNKHNDQQGGGVQLYDELTEEMKKQQAKKYESLVRMYRTIVPEEQQYGITFWGANDRDTWVNGFFKIKDWPCVFDESLKPKPAYYGFKRGLEAKN